MKTKEFLKRTWYFIWYDDSLLSWVVNVIIAFILVKFLIYPGLGLLFSTSHPLVAVVSGSMQHTAGFDQWWEANSWYEKNGFEKEEFKKLPFYNGFNKGDIMVLVGTDEIEKGDVIVFYSNYKNPVIHRVVEIAGENYKTKGDNNFVEDQKEINSVIGKAVMRIPWLGWIKIIFTELFAGGV